MEVSPDIYAWLSSLNILDCIEALKNDKQEGFFVPERTCELLVGGKYMDKILKSLEDCYSKFYKLKIDYTSSLVGLKEINVDDEYIPNSIKFFNWNLINECMNHFGLTYTDEQIVKVTNGDLEMLLSVLTQIYNLSNQLIKRSSDKNASTSIPGTNVNIPDIIQSKDTVNKSTLNKTLPVTKTEPTVDVSKIKKETDLDSSNLINKMQNKTESINIMTLNINKEYEQCSSPLEFFLISLCKNFSLNTRQAVALLSNNRKYLAILCNNGVKGCFEKVNNWVHTISVYSNYLIRLLKQWPDGLPVTYSTIGTALTSKDPKVTLSTAQVISRLYVDVGMDWEWLCREGLDAFIYGIIKHEEIKLNLLNIFVEFVRNKKVEFMMELKKKSLVSGNKRKLFVFISSILSLLMKINDDLANELKTFIFELCLNEEKDKSMAISLLSEAWRIYFPIDENIAASIISYLKNGIRDIHNTNIPYTAIAHSFIILKNFSESKNQFAPSLYRMLVFLLMENYEDEYKREFFFSQFEKFLFENQTVPIDILLSPYFSLLNKSNSYNLSDMVFLFKILEHPRIESQHIISIITVCLKVLIHKLELARTANLILLLLFEKDFYGICSEEDLDEIERLFIEYITTTINLFSSTLTATEDTALLETPIDIMGHKFRRVNDAIFNDVVNLAYEYRKKKSKNSASILSMLWQYNNNDEILLQIEETFRIIYEPVADVKIKQEKLQKEKDKKDFNKQAKNVISSMIEKKKEQVKKYEIAKQNEDKRKESLKKSMARVRKRASISSGVLPAIPNSPLKLYASFTKREAPIITTTTAIAKTPKKLLSSQKITLTMPASNSNMTDAIEKAHKNLEKKKIFLKTKEKEKEPTLITSPSFSKKRAKTETQDEVYSKFGVVYSVDKVKEIEEEMKRQRDQEKFESQMQLILPEGTVINIDKHKNNFKNSLSYMSKRVRQNYKTSEVYKNFILPIRLEEEEDRETKAINGYKKQYEKNIKYFFKTYGDQENKVISKSRILMMFREKGYGERQINLDELTLAIHNTFDENLTDLYYEEFSELLIQLSFLIYTKVKDCVTISEAYGNLLRRFVPNQETEATQKLNKKMKPMINLIKQKAFNPKDDDDSDFNLPPGFKIQNKTVVKYQSRLPPHFVDIIGEGNYICYEIIEDIIFRILNSSTIEPYVKIYDIDDIILEPEKVKNWSMKITKGYINMGYENKNIGIAVSDCLENMLRKICKNKDKEGNDIMPPIKKKEMEEREQFFEAEEKKKEQADKRRKYLKKKLEQYKKQKEDQLKEKEEAKKKRFEKLRKEIELFQEEAKQKREMVKEKKKKIEEDKKNSLNDQIEKKKEEKEQKAQQRIEYLKKKRKKLKDQFSEIKLKKQEFDRQKFYSIPINQALPSVKKGSYKKMKQQADFEKTLNQTVEDILKREDIKSVIDKYNNHIHIVYDIYSKIGYNKISFFSKESMSISEFREFLINFTVLGLLISTDQMNWIFQKISLPLAKDRDAQLYFDEDDFKKALVYLTMFAKFTFKSRRLVQADVENMNGECMEDFFKYIRFQLPFNKGELEGLINERRSMSFKELLSLQREIKKEIFKFNQTEEDKKKEKEREEKAKIKEEERKAKIEESEANTSKVAEKTSTNLKSVKKGNEKEESKNQTKTEDKNKTKSKLNTSKSNSLAKDTVIKSSNKK